jgi:P4 family phage/plasmid primase-like protien
MDEPTYDINEARRFLRMLDPHASEFCFALFKKTKEKDSQKPPIYGRLEDLESNFAMNQQRGFNVTVVTSETHGASMHLKDITRIRAAFIDFDAKLIGHEVDYKIGKRTVKPLDITRLTDGRHPPHMIIESSPGCYHAYWALQADAFEESDIDAVGEAYAELQRSLAYFFGGDPSTTGLNKCMRVPGYWRFKEDDGAEPSVVKIIWEADTDMRYPASQLLEVTRAAIKAAQEGPQKAKPVVKTRRATDEEEGQEDSFDETSAQFGSDEGREAASRWLRTACLELSGMFEGGRDNKMNEVCWTAGGYIAGGCLDERVAKEAIEEAANKSGLDKSRIKDKLSRVIEQGKNKPIIVDPMIISFERPKDLREKFLRSQCLWRYKGTEWCTLIYWTEDFWLYNAGGYRKVEVSSMNAIAARWLNTCKRKIKTEKAFVELKFQAKTAHWNELVSQLKTAAHHPSSSETGGLKLNSWMPGSIDRVPVEQCIPMMDGIYHVGKNELGALNPGYFTTNSLQVRYNDMLEDEPTVNWNYFLESVFRQDDDTLDVQSIDLLQEWFGYCFTADVSRHKFMALVGPPRAGKGLIAQVLTHILGATSVGSFDFSLITKDFGLEDMVTKQLVISPDVRDLTSEINRVLDVFLRMTSSDVMGVQRKNKSKLDVQFPAKVMFMTNEVPEFKDTSGAILSRLLLIQLHQSFVGREDTQLLSRILPEAPGIVKWGIEGLKRLLRNGKFTLPETALETRNEIAETSSPLIPFSNECLDFDENFCCNKDWLYAEYSSWAANNGFKMPMNKIKFYRQLKGTFGHRYQNRTASPDAPSRVQYIKGIGIRNDPNKGNYTSVSPPMDKGQGHASDYNEANPPPRNDVPF